MVNPPKEGEESYPQWKDERAATLASLRRRAHTMTDAFNACEGISCNFTEGAMYSFPRLTLSPKVPLQLSAVGCDQEQLLCIGQIDSASPSTPGTLVLLPAGCLMQCKFHSGRHCA